MLLMFSVSILFGTQEMYSILILSNLFVGSLQSILKKSKIIHFGETMIKVALALEREDKDAENCCGYVDV